MNADFSHYPQDILKLLELAEKGSDLVLGSRYCNEGEVRGWNLTRLLVSKVANRIIAMLIKLPLTDYTTGFRCYSKDYIVKVLPKLHSQTYGIQIETLRQAKLQNSKITEIAGFSKYILKVICEQLFEQEPELAKN